MEVKMRALLAAAVGVSLFAASPARAQCAVLFGTPAELHALGKRLGIDTSQPGGVEELRALLGGVEYYIIMEEELAAAPDTPKQLIDMLRRRCIGEKT
jgi:hypothetical protein